MKTARIAIASLALMAAGMAHAQTAPASVESAAEAPMAAKEMVGDEMQGIAAWYGRKFSGRRTASGKRFNPNAMTAAHRTLPFGTKVKVTNMSNERSVVVIINDRGPTSRARMLDVSRAAARKLGFQRAGLTEVKLEMVN